MLQSVGTIARATRSPVTTPSGRSRPSLFSLTLAQAALLLAGLGCLQACGGGGWPEILDSRHIEAPSGPPTITQVRDMGNPALPESGPYAVGESDGVAVVGELLLVEGKNLGKQPTVTVGGRAAAVFRRTEGGGIVVRVPVGTPSGGQPVEVVTARGRARFEVPVRRLALVTLGSRDKVHVLAVGRDSAEPVGTPLPISNARAVRFSPDGSAAYVATASGTGPARLVIVDMTAKGGPRIAGSRDLPFSSVVALAASEREPRIAVVSQGEAVLFDVSSSLSPSHNPTFRFPEALAKAHVVAAEIDPDASLLAVLLAEKNRLAVFDIRRPAAPEHMTTVDLLPESRASVVRDMRFSIDGETLWVVSGDTSRSAAQGPQPTRLSAVRLTPAAESTGPRVVSVWRTMPVPGATAPVCLSVARGQMVASGTTIRLPPEKAAVFVTAVEPSLFKLDGPQGLEGKQAAALFRTVKQPGMVVRADINGGGGPLFSTDALLTGVDLTPDAQLIVAVAAKVHAQKTPLAVEGGLLMAPVWASAHRPVFVSLGPIDPDLVRPPFRLGEVRIQP